VNTEFKKCNRCGVDIFFPDTGKTTSGWEAFDADVSEIKATGIRYADGFDKVKVTEQSDIGKKGFRKHKCR
jgi:hypothetical protein